MAVQQCPKPSGDRALHEPHIGALKPALASIPDACKYMGGVSRAKFYADLLPHLNTVHIGSRHFVVVKSMDRLIAKLKAAPTPRGSASKRGGRRIQTLTDDNQRKDVEMSGVRRRLDVLTSRLASNKVPL
jgi:hypothetical protein